jgi:serine/threonine-protein kinase HipA
LLFSISGKAVSKWRAEAARQGLTKREIERMVSAFEHDDLRLLLGK